MPIFKSKKQIYRHERPIPVKNVDIDKTVVSNKVPFGKKRFKYFIEYKNAKIIKPLCIFLPKMSAYRKDFDLFQ